MGEQKPSHITRVAESLMGKLKIRVEDALITFREEVSVCPQKLYERRGDEVRYLLGGMSPETLGRIAVQGKGRNGDEEPWLEESSRGKTELYDVHCGSYLGKYKSGRHLLLELATTAVIAEMTDQLKVKMQREATRETSPRIEHAN